METPISITRTERVDDIPLLLAQMEKMNIAALLDKHFPMHGNWQGLSLGEVVVVWLAYILSEGDHRLNSVQGWVAGILMTLTLCLKAVGLRELDFSDDRLAVVVERLGQDEEWEAYESEQGGVLLRVYDLKVSRVRVEFTVRKALQEQGAKLDHIYAGNPKRATAKPTTEMMLLAFRGLSLNVVNFNGVARCCMTPLNAVQTRILGLIGFPPAIYQVIEMQSG